MPLSMLTDGLSFIAKTTLNLNGKILAGALKLAHINVVSIKDGKLTESKRLLESLGERVRDITISPDGYIYFSTDSGKIIRLQPQ
ncbi:PQQ-dependent sugar dehydrogenase [Vibrio sp. SA48]